jgi:hypothetical protein
MVSGINYNAFITDNFFDAGTVDGSNINTLTLMWSTFTIYNNFGSTGGITIGGEAGIMAETPADNLSSPNSLLYTTSGNVSGSALIGPFKDGLKFGLGTDLTAPALMYIPDSTQRGIIWSIPLKDYVPLNTYITQITIVAYATTKFSQSSVLQALVNNSSGWIGTGSETTPVTYDFGNTGTYVPNTHITLTITIPYGSARVAPDIVSGKFPNLVMHGSPFSDAGGGQFFINPVQVLYRW